MFVQPGGHESPQLIQPHGRGQNNSRNRRHLELQDEGVGHPGEGKGDVATLFLGLLHCTLKGLAQKFENCRVRDPTNNHADNDGDPRLDEA